MTKSTFNLFRGLFLGLLAVLLQAGLATASTLQPNANGTVTDPNTGLVWMRCAMGQTWTGSTCYGTPNNYTYYQANALTGRVTFAGQNDWRVPNIRELQTIVDRSVSGMAIDSAAFPNTPILNFWSSSLNAGSLDYANFAWGIDYYDGGVSLHFNYSSMDNGVRLVRGGQSFSSLLRITRPSSDYVDNGDGTVTHTPTSLMWKRCSEGQTWTGSTCSGTTSSMTASQAKALSSGFAGKSDWRLPTPEELSSLVDYSTYGPAINTSIFPATPSLADFWSTSPYIRNLNYVWDVNFDGGFVGSSLQTDGNAVRLVRSGPNAGKAYRLYQAAFDRTPDPGGLAYWIDQMGKGMDLLEVAARFVDSAEFKSMYGTNPTNAYFLIKLYDHVLHRAPEQAGYDWWLNELNSGRYSQTKALASFSESDENKANVCRNGCPY